MFGRPRDLYESFVALLIIAGGYEVGGPPLLVFACLIVFGSVALKIKKQYDPLNRADAEVSRTKDIIGKYSTELYQQSEKAIRRQIEIALVERIDTLSQIALGVARNLDSKVLDRRILARKFMPEIMSVLLEARAKYHEFTGAEAPGLDSLSALNSLAVEAAPEGVQQA